MMSEQRFTAAQLRQIFSEVSKQQTQEQIEQRLRGVATQETLNSVLQRLDDLEGRFKDGTAKVEAQLSGQITEIAVVSWDDLPDPASVPLGATAQLIGTFDVRQSNGSDWVEAIL